jgi:DNA-binding response OmpR family regulator
MMSITANFESNFSLSNHESTARPRLKCPISFACYVSDASTSCEQESKAEERGTLSASRPVKLLLVSDDDVFCSLLRAYLQHLGFSLLTCSTSDRAESLFLTRNDIDLWLVDTQALGVEGAYVAVKVRELHPLVPIVLFAGSDQKQSTLQRFFWNGWIRVEKSADLGSLLAVIQRALSDPPLARKDGPAAEDSVPAFDDWITDRDRSQQSQWRNRN